LIQFDEVEYATGDAASDAKGAEDAGVDADAVGPSYVDPGIGCGPANFCDPTRTACCTFPAQCVPTAAANSPDACVAAVFRCDSTGDCLDGGIGNSVCCLRHNGSGAYTPIGCEPFVACLGGLHAVLCDPVDPSPCPESARCLLATENITDLKGRYRCTLPDGAPL
jgi:hypothetical protein